MRDEVQMVIMLNGPPGCGKDTWANAFCDVYREASVIKFAGPIKSGLRAMYSISDEEWKRLESPQEKEKPQAIFQGLTTREVQIKFGEGMRKLFGEAIFGWLAIQAIEKALNKRVIILSDLGFPIELQMMREHFGDSKCVLVHCTREGCSFANDSRNFVEPEGVELQTLRNDGTEEELREKAWTEADLLRLSFGG